MFPAYRFDNDTIIETYYKIQRVNDKRNFDDIEYVKAELDIPVSASTDDDDVRNYNYTVNNLEPFTAVACKIVMKTPIEKSSKVTRILDFRMIALAA
jgi:hypothetical protein